VTRRSAHAGSGSVRLEPRTALKVGLLAFLVVATVLVGRTATAPGFQLPSRWYDAQDYENLAYHIARGDGFGVGWDDPAWLAPYRDPRTRDGYKWIDYHLGWRPRVGGFSETTVRPPALPYVMALTYRIFGRDFGAIRVVNALFLALAIATATGLAALLAGRWAAAATALLGLLAPHYGGFARLSMTEPLSSALVIAAISLLCVFSRTGRLRWCALAGAAIGAAILTRSALLLSLPFVAAALYGLARWDRQAECSVRPASMVAMFLLCAVLIPTPWWARNCWTLGAFMPLGAQGGIGLPGAYSDQAHRRTLEGLPWTQPNRWNFFQAVQEQPTFQELPPVLKERELAKFGQARALAWIADNPGALPVLAWKRLQIHWTVRDIHDVATRVLALGGFLALAGRREAWIAASFVLANSLAVMATFVVSGGRFLAPIEPVLYLFAGAGVALGTTSLRRHVQRLIRPARAEPSQSP
jgi:hypothetical protein